MCFKCKNFITISPTKYLPSKQKKYFAEVWSSSNVVLKLSYEQFWILEVASSSRKTKLFSPDLLMEGKLYELWMGRRRWCCWKDVLALEEGVGQGCSVPASTQVVLRNQVWLSGALFQGWRVCGRNKNHSEEAGGDRRNYFSKYVLYCQRQQRVLTWYCLELNQSKFRNVGFFRGGLCCCSFPDSRFLRLILVNFTVPYLESTAWQRPTV